MPNLAESPESYRVPVGNVRSRPATVRSVFLVGLLPLVAAPLTSSEVHGANEKIGVSVVSDYQAVPYAIRFENVASASGPVQQVILSDPLDVQTLDPRTVSLDAITFGPVRIVPPPGLRSYATQVDLRPRLNLKVNVSAAVDLFTGVLSWYFTSIDPETDQPPTDPAVGFLPPNIVPPEGEGSVLFTVIPLPNQTVISNQAVISFDESIPINTNVVQTTIDREAPASHVLPLNSYSDETAILVEWTADGAPADLRDFTIYVSEDGAPYRVWQFQTMTTADTLVPPSNHQFHQYSFYSEARDLAGNIEPPPEVPDATTQARTGVDVPRTWTLSLDAGPNPAVGTINVRLTLPNSMPATIELFDVGGRRILRREVGQLGAGPHEVVLAAPRQFGAGVYFLRLEQGPAALRARVAIVD
jgi:hypothetical protein